LLHHYLLSDPSASSCFFFPDPAPTEIYTLSLHDALPICATDLLEQRLGRRGVDFAHCDDSLGRAFDRDHRGPFAVPPCVAHRERSEEHTSELQSRSDLVCRLLLEKKKK